MGYLTIFILVMLSVRLNVSQYYKSQRLKEENKKLKNELDEIKNKKKFDSNEMGV